MSTCPTHGGQITFLPSLRCQTADVLDEVSDERAKQFERYGTNEDIVDGTGDDTYWLGALKRVPAPHLLTAEATEQVFREDYEKYEQVHGKPTWMHLLREEVAEVFQEHDPSKLREELIQVAALAVSWIEKLDAR